MLFQMLSEYIENKLYVSIEEVQEKIVIYYALDKLTSGEFMTLFDLLFPKTEEVVVEEGVMTLELTDETVSEEPVYPMPINAIDIVARMIKANRLENAYDKLSVYVSTGQLSESQCESFFIQDDTPIVLPEVDDVIE